MAKTGVEKELEKQRKENKKATRDQVRQLRAKAIVDGAKYVSEFRIMDDESEELLKEILAQYDGNERNRVDFDLKKIASSLRDFAHVGYETLKMYGVLSSTLSVWGNGAIITLSESGKSYFKNKQNALDKKEKATEETQGLVNIQGCGNSVQVQSNTLNSTQTQDIAEIYNDYEAIERLLDQLFSYQSIFNQEFGEQGLELEQAITEAKTATEEKEPKRLKKALDTIKYILENAAGSLIATGALAVMAQIPSSIFK